MTDSPTVPPPIASLPDLSQVKTSKASIGSLVFGILSFCLSIFGTIPAVVLGIVAIVKINNSGGHLTGKGLAIAGIVLGGVGLFVSAILAAIVMPAMVGVQDRAASIKEVNNVKNLALGCKVYALDWDGAFPGKLQDLYPDYIDVEELLKAVDPKTKEVKGYIYFPGLKDSSESSLPLIASPIEWRGNKRVVALVGGQVKLMREEEYQELLRMVSDEP